MCIRDSDNPETDQADFGAKGLDKFENSLSNGIKFTQIGYRSIPTTSSLTFTSTINVTAYDGSSTLTVNPLPVNLEAGEIVENENDSENYFEVTERALQGSTSIVGTLIGSTGAFKRVVTLFNLEIKANTNSLEGKLSPAHNKNKITSVSYTHLPLPPIYSV